MGVFRLPWVSEEWFWQCPFNYCDHFGDKETLAAMCIICREELAEEITHKQIHDATVEQGAVFDNLTDALHYASGLVGKELKEDPETGEIAAEEPESLEAEEKHPLYYIARKYGRQIHAVCMTLLNSKELGNNAVADVALDILLYSEHYIAVKIARAVSSSAREAKMSDELGDSKTSAFFAYIAAVRNSKALRALTRSKLSIQQKHDYKHLAELSDNLSSLIKREFFADVDLNYEEYGTERYYQTLAIDPID